MKTIKWLKIAAMVPLGFVVSILLVFAIGESVGGDLSGLMHLVPVVLVVLVSWFCWKRTLWGGILLLLAAIFEAVYFGVARKVAGPGAVVSPLTIMILPLSLSGVFLLTAEWIRREKAGAG